jgi:hypothetical protein
MFKYRALGSEQMNSKALTMREKLYEIYEYDDQNIIAYHRKKMPLGFIVQRETHKQIIYLITFSDAQKQPKNEDELCVGIENDTVQF